MMNKSKVLERGVLNRQSLLKVYILPEGGVEFDVITVSTGAIHDRCRCSSKEITINDVRRLYENFNEDMIILNLSGISGTRYIELFSEDIVIDVTNNDVYYRDSDSIFRSWKAPKNTISESEADGFIRVKPALMSPSQEKAHEVTCLVCDEEHFENKIDRLTDGLFSIMKRTYKGVSYEKLIKLAGYMATGLAPSRKFEYSINSIAIFMSKSRMADGAGFIKAKGGVPAGIGVQARNFGSDKGHYLSIREEVMKEYVDNFKAEKVHIKEVTKEIQRKFEEAFARENEFSGKLLIIGEGTPDLFMDMNIIKAPFDLTRFRRNELRVLDISPNSRKEIAFGSQMAQTLIMNDKAKEVLTRKIEESLRTLLEDFCNKEAEVLLTFNQFLEGLEYVPGLIEKINPGMKFVDPSLYRVARETLYNKITGILSEFRIPISGTFARVFCDFAEDFGEKILKENEIFSPDLEKKGVKYAVGIRSPKGGLFEFNVYKVINKREINRRIRSSKRLRGHAKGALIRLFGSIKPGSGLAVVAASRYVMLLHSGMDFDYDGLSLFWDKAVVELFSGIRPTALLVEDEGNTTSGSETYNVGDMAAVIKGQFASPNLPVGVVCNHAHTWLSLLNNLDFARTVLKQMFGLGDNTEYEPLEREALEVGDLVRIDAKKVEEILTRVKNINFDKAQDKTIIDILIDINHVMNRFIQKTIDASKTGESIVIPKELLVNDVVDNLSLRQMRISSQRISERQMAVADGLYIEVEPKGPSYQLVNKDGKIVYTFSDFIHEVRKEALRRVLPELRKIATYEPKLGPELAAARQTVVNKLCKETRNDLILFKKYYGDLTGHRSTSISKINETHNRFIRDELVRRVNKDYKASLEYLANSIRLATASMSPIERILALMGIASNPREGMDAPSSSMPLNTLSEEYIILASKFGGTKFIGERIRGASTETLAEGGVVTVKDGMIAGSDLIVELPDGEYVTKHIDGAVYAVKTIEEAVKDLELMKLNNKLMVRLSSGVNIDLADIPNEAKIVTWKYAGRDAYGDLAIDLAAGHTPYSKVLANVVAKVDKTIRAEVSYRNGKGLSTILCLSAIRREGKPSAKTR